jgi:hypothetical protein
MRSKATLWLILLALAALIGLFAGEASAVLYTFDSDPPPDWGNERGNWIASGGVYYAQEQAYPNYTSLLFNLTNFVFEVDVANIGDGGIWLRSDYNGGNINGVIFVMARGYTYWEKWNDGVEGPALNWVWLGKSNAHFKVVVNGDNYAVYADGNLINTLITDEFPSGRVGLYHNLSGGTITFDNANLVPIPATLLLLGSGLAGLAGWRKSRRS